MTRKDPILTKMVRIFSPVPRLSGLLWGPPGCSLAAVLGRFFKYWLPVVLWMSLTFGASTGLGRPEYTARFIRPLLIWLVPNISEKTIRKVHFAVRKSAHFVEYCGLGLLLWRLVHFDPAFAALRPWEFLIALFFAALYAASDEFHQYFVPGREAAARDVLLDSCGAGFGLAALWVARRLWPEKSDPMGAQRQLCKARPMEPGK